MMNPNPEIAKALLKGGADPNHREENGWTALHWAAARQQNPEVITALAEAGANPNGEAGDGETPLRLAVTINEKLTIITALVNLITLESKLHLV